MEAALTGRGGGAGGYSDCNHRLRDPPRTSHLLQLPWEIPIGVRKRLAGCGVQLMEGAIEVVATAQGIGKVGRGCPEVGKNLCGGGPVSSALWIVDVVDETAH